MPARPVIVGVTCHAPRPSEGEPGRVNLRRGTLDAIVRAGGTPVLLPPLVEHAREHLRLCDAFVFTGGDDPRTEEFGAPGPPTHPRATVMDPDRQRHEVTLLRLLRDEAPHKPVLGICLGMQLMALVAGGELNQCLDDDTPTHADHAPARQPGLPGPDRVHPIAPEPGVRHPLLSNGQVNSWHRQAVRNPGSLRVLARAHDGVIEAVDDPSRPFYLGVQWHPERFAEAGLDQASPLGDGVFAAMCNAAK